ncbi:glycine-rich domain-containing protein [Aeromonas sp. QDB68]|uniref:glycine-rich domain-containing protein n=1 Tax=Aeromonas sp. QDB68 TaxID=2989823 RepID=UPI0022E4A271|nr:hypothetical protein [Aeromonas sp. QDB68]
MITLGGQQGVLNPIFRNDIRVFDINPGTRQWTVPAGVSRVRVAVIGAGSGYHKPGSNIEKGGHGGGFAEKIIDVMPGQTYSYTVGAGGQIGKAGGSSSFGGFLSATGGGARENAESTPGIGSGGDVNTSGGKGASVVSSTAGGGASGHRYGSGGDAIGSVGGGWGAAGEPLKRADLFDDGWGLGIHPYRRPLHEELVNFSSYMSFARVGEGVKSSLLPNYGSGGGSGNGGIGAGCGSAGVVGGNGAIIIEVVA